MCLFERFTQVKKVKLCLKSVFVFFSWAVMSLFKRLFSRSWACVCVLLVVCITVNMLFWGWFPVQSFSKSHLYMKLEDIFVGTTNSIPSDTIVLKPPFKKIKIATPPEKQTTTPLANQGITTRENQTKLSLKSNTTEEKQPKMSFKINITTKTTPPKNINEHDFKYIMNEPEICKTPPVLIIVVCTAVQNVFPRTGVRLTWGSTKILEPYNSTLVFLVGQVKSKLLQEKLEDENRQHHDIVQADFIDSYKNLTLKSIALLHWVKTFCARSTYVLKADDDMYVSIPNLIEALRKMTQPKFILGHVFQRSKPIQNKRSKWYTPLKEFSEKFYPKYVSGTTYAVSTSAVADLYSTSLGVKLFWLEDVYTTGLLARKAGVPRVHNPQFHYTTPPASGCTFKTAITGHRYRLTNMLKIHNELYGGNLTCKT